MTNQNPHGVRIDARRIALAVIFAVLGFGCTDHDADDVLGPRISAQLVAANAGDQQTAIVGTPVAIAPSVKVTDSQGNPAPGVSVTFAVATGGGTITGAMATSNAKGIATVGSWTLGSTIGANTLSATSGSLPAVTFTASGASGLPATLTKNAADNQSASAEFFVPVAPAVTVKDKNGNVVSGAMVIFEITGGAGDLTTIADPTQHPQKVTVISGADGVAALKLFNVGLWGATVLTVTASPAPAVTFTATATCPTRNSTVPATSLNGPFLPYAPSAAAYTYGSSVAGTLTTSSCIGLFFNDYLNYYSATLPTLTAGNAYQFSLTSSAFVPEIVVWDGTPIGIQGGITGITAHNKVLDFYSSSGTVTIRALFPSGGPFIIGAESFSGTGAYTLTTGTVSANTVCGSAAMVVVPNVTTAQTLSTSDCVGNGSARYDSYLAAFFFPTGFTTTPFGPYAVQSVSMTSTDFPAYLEVWDYQWIPPGSPAGTPTSSRLLASSDSRSGSTNTATINVSDLPTDDHTGVFEIRARSALAGQTGNYTLTLK